MNFEFYVLNYNTNKRKVEVYNIFQNIKVFVFTRKALRKYIRSPKKFKHVEYKVNEPDKVTYGFEALCATIRSIIMWQMWSRRQYEISVGDAFEQDVGKLEKWDCYEQALPNIEIIARECIYQYRQQVKKENKNDKIY